MRYPTACPKHSADTWAGTPANGCKACDKLAALAELRALCPPGTTVYTILRSVSRSGLSRTLTPCILRPEGDAHPRGALYDLSHLVGPVLGLTRKDGYHYNAVRIDGAGMDMGFHLVYSLSCALHGTTPRPADVYLSETARAVPLDNLRPGYTLNHRWL